MRSQRRLPWWGLSLLVHGGLLGAMWFLSQQEPASAPSSTVHAQVVAVRPAVEALPDAEIDPLPAVQPIDLLELPEVVVEPALEVPPRFVRETEARGDVAVPLDLPMLNEEALRRVSPPATPVPAVPPTVTPPSAAPAAAPAPRRTRSPGARASTGGPLRVRSWPRVASYYPPVARRMGLEGEARVLLAVHVDGSVTDASITRSSGYDILDTAALRYARAIAFVRGTAGQAELPVRFRLQ